MSNSREEEEEKEVFALPDGVVDDPLRPNASAIALPVITGVGGLGFLAAGIYMGLRQVKRRVKEDLVKEGVEKVAAVPEVLDVLPGTRLSPRAFAMRALFIGTVAVVGFGAVGAGTFFVLEKKGYVKWPDPPPEDGHMDKDTRELWNSIVRQHRLEKEQVAEQRKAAIQASREAKSKQERN